MIDALLRDGIIAETQGDYRLGDGATLIEDATTGLMLTTLRVTEAGLTAIGHAAPTETAASNADTAPQAATDTAATQQATAVADAPDAATVAPTAGTPARATLCQAAEALLARPGPHGRAEQGGGEGILHDLCDCGLIVLGSLQR